MLEKVSLFSNLAEQEISELEAIGQERSVAKNSVVINEGDHRQHPA